CELPTDRHTIVGTPDSKLVDSSLKFSTAYGGSAAPVVVKKSTPSLNITSRTNGRVTEVGSATICWGIGLTRPSESAAARTRCKAVARWRPLLDSSSRSLSTLVG